MNADADDVAGFNPCGVKPIECFVHQNRIADGARGSRSENVKPTRGNNSGAKSSVTGVNEQNLHFGFALQAKTSKERPAPRGAQRAEEKLNNTETARRTAI